MPLERGANAAALLRRELVVQQVVGPADRVQQVPGGEVHVGLAVGVAPRLVVDRGERPLLRGREQVRLPLDRPREAHVGERVGHVVLRATLLRARRRRRVARERRQRGQHLLPVLAVRRAGALAQLRRARPRSRTPAGARRRAPASAGPAAPAARRRRESASAGAAVGLQRPRASGARAGRGPEVHGDDELIMISFPWERIRRRPAPVRSGPRATTARRRARAGRGSRPPRIPACSRAGRRRGPCSS